MGVRYGLEEGTSLAGAPTDPSHPEDAALFVAGDGPWADCDPPPPQAAVKTIGSPHGQSQSFLMTLRESSARATHDARVSIESLVVRATSPPARGRSWLDLAHLHFARESP
jgi:hypothetical protein